MLVTPTKALLPHIPLYLVMNYSQNGVEFPQGEIHRPSQPLYAAVTMVSIAAYWHHEYYS